MFAVDTKIIVRYKETDQMGIVHHSNYYTWFEVGRTEFMRALGLTYRKMEESGFMMPILETHCTYKEAARYDDSIIIRTYMAEYRGVRIAMEYQAIREKDQVIIAEGKTVHAITDNNLKPVNLKKANMDIYKVLIKPLQQ